MARYYGPILSEPWRAANPRLHLRNERTATQRRLDQRDRAAGSNKPRRLLQPSLGGLFQHTGLHEVLQPDARRGKPLLSGPGLTLDEVPGELC
jgi:hypothetical protein